MTRTRAHATAAFLALLATLAALGCRRPQLNDAPPTAAAERRAAPADAKPDTEKPRPSVAVPEATRPDPPHRPAGVPAQAFWVGGPDGGVFVLLERANDRKGTFAGKIFHPDGELWYAGPLVPAPRDAGIDPTQHDQFAGWDGERLLMADGRWLESVKTKGARRPRPH